MILARLSVSRLRNIEHIEFDPHPRVNWVSGPNGAGKSSLLEAIFLVARGRSFRGKKHGKLIMQGCRDLEVAADIKPDEPSSLGSTVRIVHSNSEMRFFENGCVARNLGEFRNRLHVRMLADNAQHLLEGHPQIRRSFLDWNLFHVEHGYGRTLSEFRRVLSQRNAWLRTGGRGPAIWDDAYCRVANAITKSRRNLVSSLGQFMGDGKAIGGFRQGPDVRVDYRQGWPREHELGSLLKEHLSADIERGYSYYGPARADFSLVRDDLGALPSRGQTKLLVFQLQLAAQRFSEDCGGEARPVWLFDDLSAELDDAAVGYIYDAVMSRGDQLFSTSIKPIDGCDGVVSSPEAGSLFHVKHGRLTSPRVAGRRDKTFPVQ